MPDLQINPLYSSLPTASDPYMPDWKVLGFQDNIMSFLPGAALGGGGSNWQLLTYYVDGNLISSAGFLHLKTVNELTAFLLFTFRSGEAPRLYAATDIDWDGETTLSITGRRAVIADKGGESAGDNIALSGQIDLRADAHSDPDIHGVKRLRMSHVVASDYSFVVLLCQGNLTNPTFVTEYQSAE